MTISEGKMVRIKLTIYSNQNETADENGDVECRSITQEDIFYPEF